MFLIIIILVLLLINYYIYFSLTVSIAEDINKSAIGIPNEQNIRTSSHSQLVGRHRITVGTCSCVGTLHYLGFNPGHFTHILVDEAGQATEPEILIPASKEIFFQT